MKELFNRTLEFLQERQIDTLARQTEKAVEEQQEFWEALAALQDNNSDGASRALALEAVDNIIVYAGIVGVLGEDGAEEFIENLEQYMYTKFPDCGTVIIK